MLTTMTKESIECAVSGSTPPKAPFKIRPRRAAIIVRDWRQDIKGQKLAHRDCGYAPHLQAILKTCGDNKCDTAMFALWSHSTKDGGKLHPKNLFSTSGSCNTVIIGAMPQPWKNERVHVLQRGQAVQSSLVQCFSASADSGARKQAFVDEFGARLFGNTFVMLCGESNIIGTRRKEKPPIRDEFSFRSLLKQEGVSVILNPIHTFMRRYEMPLKRKALSQPGISVISAWNAGDTDGESTLPWQHWHNGIDRTSYVKELPEPVSGVPGIRIAIVEIPE